MLARKVSTDGVYLAERHIAAATRSVQDAEALIGKAANGMLFDMFCNAHEVHSVSLIMLSETVEQT